METCIRGFSFMSECKSDLQYIEGGELERTWRSTRRERTKQREQKIWDNFVKEQDMVNACKDDPYQFLDPLPESCLKDVLEEISQPKITHETAGKEPKEKELDENCINDKSPTEDVQHTCVVTFAEDMDKDDCDMFHIYADESGGEDDTLDESNNTPDTVRERPTEGCASADNLPEKDIDLYKSSSQSSENIASVVESSIYCARVKELRQKINEELSAMMQSLNSQKILFTSEPEDVARMVKRSAEFCNRFNRIYMYQLQRQIHDIKRNNSLSLPFAKHTQFQSQMTRIVALHQNLLGSFQVFHKSFAQTCCVRESAGALGSLLAAVRDSTYMCLNVPPPKDFAACLDLYRDDLLQTCDKVEEFVNEYAIRCEEFLNRFETNSSYSKKIKKDIKVKKKSCKNATTNSTDTQLSMYSTDHNMQLGYMPKSTRSKDSQLGSKMRINVTTSATSKKLPASQNADPPKSTRRSRRPLMRDPHAGHPRVPKPARDTEIRTMVETVQTCASSHLISEDSPRSGARPSKRSTPRSARTRPQHLPPRATNRAPRPLYLQDSPQDTPRLPNTLENAHKTSQPSPSRTKSRKSPSPTSLKPRHQSPRQPDSSRESKSPAKLEQENEEIMPVLTIKCAMKKDLKVADPGQPSAGSRSKQSSPKKSLPRAGRENPHEKKKASTDATLLKTVYKHGESSKVGSPRRNSHSPKEREPVGEKKRTSNSSNSPDRCEVSRLIKQLCSGDTTGRTERVTGSKNVQMVYVSGSSPRQPSTPQLLRILEETIKKKIPKPLFDQPSPHRSPDRHRLLFNISEKTADELFQYRTKFVQHMLTSSMYANSAVGKPWEMIGNVSEQIIDDVLLGCLKTMELRDVIQELYKKETS